MTDETESAEGEADSGEGSAPIFLTAPDGTEYVIACEGTLCAVLGIDRASAYRVTDKGLEWLTPQRRWENVESTAARVASIRKN